MKRILSLLAAAAALLCSCKTEPAITPSITLEPTSTSYTFEAKGGSGNVVFNSTCEWTASSSESWLSASPSSGRAGDNISITLSAQENNDYDSRMATVTLKSGDVSQTISVTQSQNEGFVLTEHNFSIGSAGGEIGIPVRANIDYTCAVADDSKSWISVTKTKSLADYMIVVSVAANDSYDQRNGTLTVSYDGKNEAITIAQSQLDEMIVGTTSFEIGSDGGDISIPVSTNVEYTAEVLGDASGWLSVKTVRTKGLEECRLVLSVSKNDGYDGRIGQVKVSGAGKESFVTITQAQHDELVVSQTSFEIGSNGGVIAIPVSSNCEYSYEVLGGATWLSIEKNETKGLADSNVRVAIQKNETYDARVGQIKIAGSGKESVVTITQSQLDEMLVGTTAFEIGSDGGAIKVPVSANVEYSAELIGSSKDWIKVSSVQTKALEEYFLVLNIDKNEGHDGRMGQVKVVCADKESIITITQGQKDEILVENKTLQIGKEGGNLEVSFQTNCEYKIAVLGEAQAWISVREQPYTKWLVAHSFTIDVAANESYDNRIGQIKVYGDKAESVITVNQNQTNGLNLTKSVYEIECEGGSLTVEFQANVDASCEIEDSAKEWLTLVATRGLSAGALTFNVKANDSINDREAKVALKVDNIEQKITIRQSGDLSLIVIDFTDKYAKSACIRNFDTNGDRELSVKEAEMVKKLPSAFLTQTEIDLIRTFDELEYFKNLSSIESNCFDGCYRLTSIVVPNGSIENKAFNDCTNLVNIELKKGVKSIGWHAFSGCGGLQSVVIPDGVTAIGDYTFERCLNLKSVVIPNSVTAIGKSAFSGCSSLTSIDIPEGVTDIREYAFSGCSGLQSIVIPKSITYLRYGTFEGCISLTSVTIKRSTPPQIDVSDIFKDTPSTMHIYVPTNSVDKYKKATYWARYSSRIYPIE